MTNWLDLLAGLLVWAVHFFAVYLIGEFGGDGAGARAAILLVSLLCFVAAGALLLRQRRAADEGFERWRRSIARTGLVLAMLAVIWQALPALLMR